MSVEDDATLDKYPWWVNRVGALLLIAEGFVMLFTPWMPSWSLSFYCWWLDRNDH